MSSPRLGSDNRIPLNALLHVSWLDARGEPRHFQARTIDISGNSIHIELPEALERSTAVQMRSEGYRLACSGYVRSCIRSGFAYIVGVEFNDEVLLKQR
jgi:hypothetical protein